VGRKPDSGALPVKLLTHVQIAGSWQVNKEKPLEVLFFAKTLADCGINNIAAFASTSVLL
jgi:hypothetical protein